MPALLHFQHKIKILAFSEACTVYNTMTLNIEVYTHKSLLLFPRVCLGPLSVSDLTAVWSIGIHYLEINKKYLTTI